MIDIKIYFDGACHNKKDSKDELYGCGVAVYIDGEYSEEFSVARAGRSGTSNIAEWMGCIMSLEIASELTKLCKELDKDETVNITMYSDSQLITRQYNGIYEVKDEVLREYFQEAVTLSTELNYYKKIG